MMPLVANISFLSIHSQLRYLFLNLSFCAQCSCSTMFPQRCTVYMKNGETRRKSLAFLCFLCLPRGLFCCSCPLLQKCCFAFVVQTCFLSSPCVIPIHPFPINVSLFLWDFLPKHTIHFPALYLSQQNQKETEWNLSSLHLIKNKQKKQKQRLA